MESHGGPDESIRYMGTEISSCSCKSSLHISRKTSWGTPIPAPSTINPSDATMHNIDLFDEVDLDVDCGVSVATDGGAAWNTVENIAALGLSFNSDTSPPKRPLALTRFSLDDCKQANINTSGPPLHHRFEKWMKTLQKKAVQRRKTVSGNLNGVAHELHWHDAEEKEHWMSRHKKSSSGSSLGFVTVMKSASISLASFSMAPRSRKTGVSSRHQRTNHSSRGFNAGLRFSEESASVARDDVIDKAVHYRSLQRRQVLEEIIGTEENYIADIRFLMNVYVTLLASIPTISLNLRTSISQNLNEIIELHEELLGDLHRVVPNSEYTQEGYNHLPVVTVKQCHRRMWSLDSAAEPPAGSSWLQKIPGVTADPAVAAEVAKVFGMKLHRFFVYEEYGAKYETMVKDVASAYRTIPQWEAYQKGLEALAASLSSINNQTEQFNKSLTVGDLLVKPIQRVCRYPLLFAELLKQTPVCDCPDSHVEIDKVLGRLREMTGEINKATNDPRMKATMEKTWILQDRLFLNGQSDPRVKYAMRTLGHIHMCGVLYFAWQTRDVVDGQYMVSLLYRGWLVMASVGKAHQIYTIQAMIGLSDVRIEETDNGRGLQCHTAPFSWKLVFECDHQLYEMMLTACSAKEEIEWRSRLTERAHKEHTDVYGPAFYTALFLDMKSMGTVFGKPGTVARRMSIHRATTTIGPKSSLCQVIVKNTNVVKEIPRCPSSATINRSQSLLTTNRIHVLNPLRMERVRLENLLSDVWTRDILPFPGITGRTRSEHFLRTSTSSMMRKLSVASITSNFTKRSGSHASLASVHQTAGQKQEVSRTRVPHTGVWQSILTEASYLNDSEDTGMPTVSVHRDKKAAFEENVVPLMNTTNCGSPVGTMKRLATLGLKKSWQQDGFRTITPPLRTASVNGPTRNRTPPVTEPACEGAENQHHMKPSIWSKATALNKGFYGEGIRGFFL